MPSAIAWTNLPLAADATPFSAIDYWPFLAQFYRAREQRGQATGREFWPGTSLWWDGSAAASFSKNAPGYTGIIGSASASGGNFVFTDGTAGKADWPASRWYDWTAVPDQPRFYDAVIEKVGLQPWGFVRTQIIASTGGPNTFTTAQGDVLDWFVGVGVASAIGDLSGCRYVIYKHDESSHRSLHGYERWLEWPNAPELAAGTVAASTTTSITDTLPRRRGLQAGRDLLARIGGRLKRIPITFQIWNADGSISYQFAAQPAAPDAGSDYVVVATGAKWMPNRAKPAPWNWYRGIDGPMVGVLADPRIFSHHRVAGLQPTNVAAVTVQLSKPNSDNTACVQTTVDALHEDLWSRKDSETDCDVLDRPYAPDLPKSISFLQADQEADCFNFVNRRVDWHGAGVPPQNFTTATWFKAMAQTVYGKTIVFTTVVGSASFNGGAPYFTFPALTIPANVIQSEVLPLAVHYAVIDHKQKPVLKGHSWAFRTVGGVYPSLAGTLVSPTRMDLRGNAPAEGPAAYPPIPAELDAMVGMTLVIAFGWDRAVERQFKYLYPKTVFVAPAGVVPATTAEPGSYQTRAASTAYCESTVDGRTADTAIAFKDGELARYVGDRWHDPTTTDAVEDGTNPDTPTRDHFFTDWRKRPVGKSTEASSWYLRDSSRSMDGDHPDRSLWLPHNLARTESGTASGGSTTSLADATKAASALWDAATGRYTGFVVEVNEQADGSGAWFQRPIATMPAAGQLTWTVALPFNASGKAYRIREPHVLNDYKGRKLLFWVNGERYEPVITHNSDDTFFFADVGVTVPAGTYYTLQERQPGEVLKWQAAGTPQWVKPAAGPDGRGGTLRTDRRENCPTLVRRFGRNQKGDLLTNALMNQMYAGENEMEDTRRSAHWQNYFPPDPPVTTWYNSRHNQGAFDERPKVAQDAADSQFTTGTYPDPGVLHTDVNDSTLVPAAQKQFQGGSNFANIYTADSWAVLDPPDYANTTRLARTSKAFVYTSSDLFDVGAGPLPRPGNFGVPVGYQYTDTNSGGALYFDAQGSTAKYRRWSRLAIVDAGNNERGGVKVGDYTLLPPHWPPRTGPTDAQPNPNDYAQWWVASQDGVESPNPFIVDHWDMPFRDGGAGPLLPLPGAGLSGLGVLAL